MSLFILLQGKKMIRVVTFHGNNFIVHFLSLSNGNNFIVHLL